MALKKRYIPIPHITHPYESWGGHGVIWRGQEVEKMGGKHQMIIWGGHEMVIWGGHEVVMWGGYNVVIWGGHNEVMWGCIMHIMEQVWVGHVVTQ